MTVVFYFNVAPIGPRADSM